jgi:predicted TIM-barrel fold metal-dependent hydrolase
MQHRLVSSDSHVNEPADLWTSRAPASLQDRVPKVVAIAQGDAWVMSPEMKPRPVSTSAAAGVKPEDYMKKPVTYKEMRPGSFDAKARIEDMDIDGVQAEVLYPGIARALDQFHDEEVRLFCANAYNEWLADFQATDPKRLVSLAILPQIDDNEGRNCLDALARAKDMGLKGAFLALSDGGRPLSHPTAEPLWAFAEKHNVPISLHIGSGKALTTNLVDPADAGLPGVREAYLSTVPLKICDYIAVLIFSGIFERHPGLKVVIAESGVGWIPFFLERMESVYDRHRNYLKSAISKRPSELFHAHMYATFQEDASGLALRNALGIGNIMWASDYPHTDTTWPNSVQTVDRYFAEVPDNERSRILADNCTNLYRIPQ